MRTVLNSAGTPCVPDPDDTRELTRLVTITGAWCTVCHLPRTPYRGSPDHHPTCQPDRSTP